MEVKTLSKRIIGLNVHVIAGYRAVIHHLPYKIWMLSLTCRMEYLADGSYHSICSITPLAVVTWASSLAFIMLGIALSLLWTCHAPSDWPCTTNIGRWEYTFIPQIPCIYCMQRRVFVRLSKTLQMIITFFLVFMVEHNIMWCPSICVLISVCMFTQ